MKPEKKDKKTQEAQPQVTKKSPDGPNKTEIAPHFDTPTSDATPETEVEISKTRMGDGFQTDSRP